MNKLQLKQLIKECIKEMYDAAYIPKASQFNVGDVVLYAGNGPFKIESIKPANSYSKYDVKVKLVMFNNPQKWAEISMDKRNMNFTKLTPHQLGIST